jgi:hypothetical protein
MYENLLKEAKEIQSYLEIECSDNPEEVVERLKTLNVLQARSGLMLAEAKKIYRRKVSSEIAETIIRIAKEQYLSATAQNALVNSIADEEAFLVDLLDRIVANTKHQQDTLRSVLSYEKEQMRLSAGY